MLRSGATGTDMKMRSRIWRFLCSEDGPTAVEYAFMLALIIMACVVSIATLGTTTNDQFIPVSNKLAIGP